MGYDLHITRATQWTDDEPSIRAEEWLAYVEQDPELRLAGDSGPYFARWSGKSKHPDPWFDWSDGQVYTKNPDPPIIAKALDIAQAFGATVQGDDGEIYLSDGKVQRDGEIDTSPSMDWRTW